MGFVNDWDMPKVNGRKRVVKKELVFTQKLDEKDKRPSPKRGRISY